MLDNCQLGLFLSFLETLTRHRCFYRALVIHWPSSFLNRAWNRLWRSSKIQIDKINKNDYIIIAGDYNARVGKFSIDGILGTNGKITGHKLKEFGSVNELKITNTFFRHKEIHKMTWSARGYRSIIDYILTNKKLSPLVNDANILGDRMLLQTITY